MKEVSEGIYRIGLPLPLADPSGVFVYLLRGNGDYTLVDTGWSSEELLARLIRKLSEGSVQLRSITRIVLTHLHFDHYGLAQKIRELTGARLLVHRREAGFMKRLEESGLGQWLARNGRPPAKSPKQSDC